MTLTVKFASRQAEDLFEGRWGSLVKQAGEDLLEECFIDLRLIEVSRFESDLVSTFNNRIAILHEAGTKRMEVQGTTPDRSAGYRISFVLAGDAISDLDISFGPIAT